MVAIGLLSMLSISTMAAPGDVAGATLAVMSFNVRYGTANDGDNSWPHRRDLLVRTIRAYRPHIVGTQECVDFQADFLREQLTEYRVFGAGREADAGGEGMTVLYDPQVLVPLETGNFWLSETPEIPGSRAWLTSCPRMVTWARFFHRDTRRTFLYLNTHFDHVSAMARKQSAELLLDKSKSLANDIPVLITGDFNARAGESEPWKILTEGGFHDSWLTAAETKGASHTFSGFRAPKPDDTSRIDWILHRGALQALVCETVTYNEDGRYPSDHFPIYGTYVLWAE